MSQQISLKDAERKVFRAAYNDGLVDIFLGCFFLIFVIGPYLSVSLGDFWSSVVFLPFWALVYLALWLVRRYVVVPRIGRVKFGQVRKARLVRFTVMMLVINIVAFILGSIAVLNFGIVSGQVISVIFGMILLMGFSLAAYFLDSKRLFFYGLLVGFSQPVGEWLWSQGYAAHHGYPVTFGVTAGIMFLIGLFLFIRLLQDNPLPKEENASRES